MPRTGSTAEDALRRELRRRFENALIAAFCVAMGLAGLAGGIAIGFLSNGDLVGRVRGMLGF